MVMEKCFCQVCGNPAVIKPLVETRSYQRYLIVTLPIVHLLTIISRLILVCITTYMEEPFIIHKDK